MSEELDFGAEFEAARQQASTEIITTGKFEFVTARDAKVDPEICAPLDGTIYNMFDIDIPTPPLHRHCRCILVPIVQ